MYARLVIIPILFIVGAIAAFWYGHICGKSSAAKELNDFQYWEDRFEEIDGALVRKTDK